MTESLIVKKQTRMEAQEVGLEKEEFCSEECL